MTCVYIIPEAVFLQLESERKSGLLRKRILGDSTFWYEKSTTHPQLIDRVTVTGIRTTGYVVSGQFVAITSA